MALLEELLAPIIMECAGISRTSDVEREQITRLVESIMPPPAATFGHTNLIKHQIKGESISPRMLEIAQEEVRRMFSKGVTEPSSSELCSAPVIVKKANGGHWFCIDFRDLNKVTRPDAYPMLSVDSIINRLRDAHYDSLTVRFQQGI